MQLASIFHDHGVLQRDLPLPIWGLGEPDEQVTVCLAGHKAYTQVDGAGCWMVRMPALRAGGPHELVVEAKSGRAVARDLLVGEVWVCSGQSNMQWMLQSSGPEWMKDATTMPQVRLLTIDTPARLGRTRSFNQRWTPSTPESLAAFSAVGGYFGQELHRKLNVPIGLICNAWGGTRIQAWMSREALYQDPHGRDEINFYESYLWKTAHQASGIPKTMAEREREAAPADPGNLGLERGWTGEMDDSTWKMMPVPSHWQDHGHEYSGIFWFRHTVTVPAAWAGKDLELHLGAIDKHDETWVNGESVGAMSWEVPNAWCTPRVYRVPGRLIGRDGRVVIAVRARSHIYHGGLTGPTSAMCLHPVGEATNALPLAGAWRYMVEHNFGQVSLPMQTWGADNQNSPYMLFDSRLNPLIPYGIRGVLWYQGESNASEAALYRRLLPQMIRDWRRVWGQGDFPFYQVQLANYQNAVEKPGRSDWAELREAQLAALEDPTTGMAVTIDIGEAADVHPKNKRDVGLRLARWALSQTYGRGGVPSGPVYTGMTIEGDGKIRCTFKYVGGGLVARGGALRHFAIAGGEKVFTWAQAVIEGDSVVVWHPDIPRPMAVRYAWANNPEGCNLYNAENLPASPFRTDHWPA